MKFLEERKKAAAAAKAAQEENKANSVQGTGSDVPASRPAQDAWRWMNGRGALGEFTVFFHSASGAVLELWHGV